MEDLPLQNGMKMVEENRGEWRGNERKVPNE